MTIDPLQLALHHHQSGRLAEAESLYRQILTANPDHPDALHLLGVLAGQIGRLDDAIGLMNRAIALSPANPAYHSNLGHALKAHGQLDAALAAYHHALQLKPDFVEVHNSIGCILKIQGRLEDAVVSHRRAIQYNPQDAQAHNDLGIALLANGQIDEAIAAYRQALNLSPDFAAAHNNLGIALMDKGELDPAIAVFRRAIELHPDLAESHNNLGNALHAQDQHDKAAASYRQALQISPNSAEVHYNLGITLQAQGQLDASIASYNQALRLKPDYPDALINLGHALLDQGQLDQAIAACHRALQLSPDAFAAHYNLGLALHAKGQFQESAAACRRAIELQPDHVDAHIALGNALKYLHQLDESIATYRQALQLNPNSAGAHLCLGNALKDQGQVDEAIAAYRRSLQINPDFIQAESNILYALQFHPASGARAIYEEHQRWYSRRAARHVMDMKPHLNERSPDRRLRIGYVSPDFYAQAESLFVVPLLESHDHRQFEIHCYSSVRRPDYTTERIRHAADTWHDVLSFPDPQLASLIRSDRIDILIDLTMHMADNRIMLFARKPAPIQIAWLAYPGSTGLPAIDYRLTDPSIDPPGKSSPSDSEEPLRLPNSWVCYHPLTDVPPVPPRPASWTGPICFGSLNNPCKINDDVMTLWARLLQAIPESKLLIMLGTSTHRDRLLNIAAQHQVAPARIEIVSHCSRPEYLRLYDQIDITLDPFPYNGITTSCDALWMGVPIITLVGHTAPGRAGLSILTNLNLPELIAHTPDQFIQIASTLAKDRPRLANLRATLRERMQQSPLMDAPKFTRAIESAYRQSWRNYCSSPH